MAKPIRKKELQRRRAGREQQSLPLGRENYRILGLGVAVIVAGYLAMLTGSVEGFLPLVVSPLLLVTGYCIIVPFGIMYRKKEPTAGQAAPDQPAHA